MTDLDQLVTQARALAQGDVWDTPSTAETEFARQLQICNACRYCEGFCAVFPAMTRRLEFAGADLHYLAHLCHHCGACVHACQYAPPHDFGVNIAQAAAAVRGESYARFAWPQPLGRLYARQGLTLALSLTVALTLVLLLMMALAPNAGLAGNADRGGQGFYAVLPHNAMVALFAPVFVWAAVALGLGLRRFWRWVTPATSGAPVESDSAREAALKVLALTHLDGGHGEGCHNEDEGTTLARRRAHHLTFYGFLLCFAATSVATVMHYVAGLQAPYDWPSLPKLLGVPGGVMLLVGSLGLLRLGWLRHPMLRIQHQTTMDRGFAALLALIAASGLLLWLLRATGAMPALLALHLGSVLALFATMPYGKFAHGFFRTAALLRHAVERRRPPTINVGSD